jgi:hypothetical protein
MCDLSADVIELSLDLCGHAFELLVDPDRTAFQLPVDLLGSIVDLLLKSRRTVFEAAIQMLAEALETCFDPISRVMPDWNRMIIGIDGDRPVPAVFQTAAREHDQADRHRINPESVSAPIDRAAVPIAGNRSVGSWSCGEQPQGRAPQQQRRERQPEEADDDVV